MPVWVMTRSVRALGHPKPQRGERPDGSWYGGPPEFRVRSDKRWFVGDRRRLAPDLRIWVISAPTTRQKSSYEQMWCELVFREDENTSRARASAPTGRGLGRRWPPPRIPTRVPRCGIASWRVVEHPFAGGGVAPRLAGSCVRRARPSFDAHFEVFQPSHDR